MSIIVPYLPENVAFDQAAISEMSRAFEEACKNLHVFAGDQRGREIIATRVIDLARTGVIDATALRDRVMAEARVSI
jgi:hypothetical protein